MAIVWSNRQGSFWCSGVELTVSYPDNNTASVTYTAYFKSSLDLSVWSSMSYVLATSGANAWSNTGSPSGYVTSSNDNPVQIYTTTFSINRTSSDQTLSASNKITIVQNNNKTIPAGAIGNKTAYTSITISAKPVTTRTLTLNRGIGVATFTGAGTYNNGSVATTVATASTGYHLTTYVGTTADGTNSNYTWYDPNGLHTHTDTWNMTANRTVTANAALNVYTFKFNANGGTGTISDKTVTYNTNITFSNSFTKTGHTFAGWKTFRQFDSKWYTTSGWKTETEINTNGYSYSYHNNTTSYNINSSWVTGGAENSVSSNGIYILYAQWTPNSYTLTINPNGGTWNGTTSNSTRTQNYNTTLTIAPPTREGYIFAGWYKGSVGTLNNSLQDPLFINSTPIVYNNNNNGAVTHYKSSDTSGSYSKVIQITTSTNTASPGYGGYVVHGNSEANQTFIHVIRAKIPKGYKLQHYQNAVGTGASFTWLTDRDGTGDWKDYAYELTCGSSGTFSTFGFMALEAQGSLPVTWRVTGNQITKNPTSNQIFTFGAGNTTLYAQWIPKSFVKIWDGTQWQQAIPYIYNGTEWKQTMPYIYDGEEWKHMER